MADYSGKQRARELDLARAKSLAEKGQLGREVQTGNPGEETTKWWQKIKPTATGAEVPTGKPEGDNGQYGWQQRNRSIGSLKYQPSQDEGGMGSKG